MHFLRINGHATGEGTYLRYGSPIVIGTDRSCNSLAAGGDEFEGLLDQIRCQTLGVENELLPFGCSIPQSGIDALSGISAGPDSARQNEYL